MQKPKRRAGTSLRTADPRLRYHHWKALHPTVSRVWIYTTTPVLESVRIPLIRMVRTPTALRTEELPRPVLRSAFPGSWPIQFSGLLNRCKCTVVPLHHDPDYGSGSAELICMATIIGREREARRGWITGGVGGGRIGKGADPVMRMANGSIQGRESI